MSSRMSLVRSRCLRGALGAGPNPLVVPLRTFWPNRGVPHHRATKDKASGVYSVHDVEVGACIPHACRLESIAVRF